jgi:hypothetical protein
VIRQVRPLVAALAGLALVAPTTAHATQRTWRNHDGTAETSVLIDEFFDWVSTGWDLPEGSVSSANSATIRIYAQAENCGSGTSGTQEIWWGAQFAADFDPCVVFPTSGFGWAAISIPLSFVHEGPASGANYFHVDDGPGDHVARYAIDADTHGFGTAHEAKHDDLFGGRRPSPASRCGTSSSTATRRRSRRPRGRSRSGWWIRARRRPRGRSR